MEHDLDFGANRGLKAIITNYVVLDSCSNCDTGYLGTSDRLQNVVGGCFNPFDLRWKHMLGFMGLNHLKLCYAPTYNSGNRHKVVPKS